MPFTLVRCVDDMHKAWRGRRTGIFPDITAVHGRCKARAVERGSEENKGLDNTVPCFCLQYKAKVTERENAEEEEDEDNPLPELRTYTWRYSVPALALSGQSLEDAEHDIKDNLLNYDGMCFMHMRAHVRACICVYIRVRMCAFLSQYHTPATPVPFCTFMRLACLHSFPLPKSLNTHSPGCLLWTMAAAGPLKPNEAREYDCARVQFSGEVQDTYFGSYAADLKNGPGIYCFATSAFYAGEFKVCLCSGCFGVLSRGRGGWSPCQCGGMALIGG